MSSGWKLTLCSALSQCVNVVTLNGIIFGGGTIGGALFGECAINQCGDIV